MSWSVSVRLRFASAASEGRHGGDLFAEWKDGATWQRDDRREKVAYAVMHRGFPDRPPPGTGHFSGAEGAGFLGRNRRGGIALVGTSFDEELEQGRKKERKYEQAQEEQTVLQRWLERRCVRDALQR